jgi:hypothetical protein
MTREELIATLRGLHAELSTAESIDPGTREAFAKVAADIERLTDPDEPTTDEDAAASQEGLNGLLLEFEAEHPKLAETLGRLADGLANLGI